MKRFFFSGAVLLLTLLISSLNADIVILDNYSTQQNGAEQGAVGNFRKQSFTPNIAGLGALDTVNANSPLPPTVFLQSTTFLSAISNAGGNDGPAEAFINVYQGIGDGGTFIGSSLNTNDITGAVGTVTPFTWNFANLALDSSLEHAFVFSFTNTPGDPMAVRLQVARDADGSFGSSYAGGTASIFSNGDSPTAFDVRFSVTFSTIPEPTSFLVLGIGALVLLGHRRRV